MSLVAYGSSSGSETEDSNESVDNIKQNGCDAGSKEISGNENLIFSSLNSLPEPKYHSLSLNNVDVRKKDKRVIISIPSLTEFDDENVEEDIPQPKKIKQSSKGSGLMALLPDPKNKSLLVPSHVSKKSLSSEHSKSESLPISSISSKSKSVPIGKKNIQFSNVVVTHDDPEEIVKEPDISNDFFSLSSSSENFSNMKSDTFQNYNFDDTSTLTDITKYTNGLSKQYDEVKVDIPVSRNNVPAVLDNFYNASGYGNDSDDRMAQQSTNSTDSTKEEPLTLNEETLEKLCGRRNRMQKNSEEFKLIDINQDAVLADSKILLSKQLTEETTFKSSHKKNEGPSNVQKRKHQITYLAHQAKEREMELKNQWATSKLTKKQTQAKYGF